MTAFHHRPPVLATNLCAGLRPWGTMRLLTVVVFGLWPLLPGCTPQRRQWSAPQSPDALDDAAFLHALAETPTASVDEGLRAVLMVIDAEGVAATEGEPATKTSSALNRWQIALERGLIKAAWKLHPDHVLTRGVLAYMIQQACELKPDLASAIMAPVGWSDRRYAVRACADEQLLAYGSPDGRIRGGELLDAVARADAFLERRRHQKASNVSATEKGKAAAVGPAPDPGRGPAGHATPTPER